jgi:hypothetical protein
VIGILTAALAFALPPWITLAVRLVLRLPVRDPRFFPNWAQTAAGALVSTLIGYLAAGESPVFPAASAASGLLALVLWWLSRRKRKRSLLEILGYKMRSVFARIAQSSPARCCGPSRRGRGDDAMPVEIQVIQQAFRFALDPTPRQERMLRALTNQPQEIIMTATAALPLFRSPDSPAAFDETPPASRGPPRSGQR